jgi:hypothetical protein
MAAPRRSPNMSGKPSLRWTGLGLRVGEDPSRTTRSRGTQMARASNGELYFIVRAVAGDDWHAVVVTGQEAKQVVEPIGTGTYGDAYRYCVNHYHWGIVSPDQRNDPHTIGP